MTHDVKLFAFNLNFNNLIRNGMRFFLLQRDTYVIINILNFNAYKFNTKRIKINSERMLKALGKYLNIIGKYLNVIEKYLNVIEKYLNVIGKCLNCIWKVLAANFLYSIHYLHKRIST